MASPISLNQWEWTRVATGITSAVAHNKQTGFEYFYTLRTTGDTAPADITVQEVPAEAIRLFDVFPFEILRAQYSFDLYVFCFSKDNRNTATGAIIVNEAVGSTEGEGSAYLNVGQSFNLKVNQGLIPGHSPIDKFGENPDIDTATTPEDVWEYGGLYTYDADGTAPIVSLVSDAADTVPIRVQGLDIDGVLTDQTVTLTGTTRVALTTPLWRVFRMSNEGTADLSGTCYCYTGTGNVPGAGEVRAIIDDGNNQTLMALYTVPANKVGFLYRGEFGASRALTTAEVQGAYYSRRYGKVFKIKKRINISNAGSSIYQDERSFPDVIPALTDIKLTVESVSANNIGVFGTFDILLIDEELFPDSYLTAIGQPGY